ncbi:unnamed protein product [Ilex paraguariensis]|uniref:Dynamin stalk domain-containing protein n=1 Tax=Ilex paraguariensis TaxID=185542 RepID=A0ABC8SJN0_9AQUA
MSTKELSGGARIHYIFQSIFVKSLEGVDPCEDLTNEDIRTAIQNATGTRNALFVPEVPFEVLVRRQIGRLLDPSLQCLRYVYDELIQMSRACEAFEIRRFPLLRRRLDEVMGKFLRDGVKPAESMICNIIEMEMDYINSSHPNFIGGKKAVELAMQHVRSSEAGRTQSNNDKPASVGMLVLYSGGNGTRHPTIHSSPSLFRSFILHVYHWCMPLEYIARLDGFEGAMRSIPQNPNLQCLKV